MTNKKTLQEIKELLKQPKPKDLEVYAKISDDSKSLLIRIPAKIRDVLKLQKGQYIKFFAKVEKGNVGKVILDRVSAKPDSKIKKKEIIDSIDKVLLDLMLKSGCDKGRWFSTNEITESSGLNWRTVSKHLKKLETQNYTIKKVVGETRSYKRKGKSIKARRKVEWALNV